jgi:hypothetical protein
VTYRRTVLLIAGLIVACLQSTTSSAQLNEAPSCAEKMTEQLRRFSEKCVSDLVNFVATQPGLTAKIYSEKEKYYVTLRRVDDALVAEAVSKFNHPLMKADTPDILKQRGWSPPENEADNWKKQLPAASVRSGSAAEEISRALAAYGLQPDEAMSITIATGN